MDTAKQVLNLNIDDVLPNRFQPRIRFNEEALDELTNSIKEHGVIQPITVRPIGNKYEIVAGERRYKASVLAGKKTIPAIVVNLDDNSCAEIALIENVQRQDLTPIEEAISYKKILDMGALTQEALAIKLGKNQSTIANKLRLLNLDEEVQRALLENRISERHARSLLKLSEKEKQKEILHRIINERLTVRRTDEEISKVLNIKENKMGGESDKMNNNISSNPFGNGMNEVPQMNASQPVNQFGGMNEVLQMNASQPVNQFGGMNEVPQMNASQPVNQFGGMNEEPQMNASQPVNQFGGMNEEPQMNASQPVNQFGGMNEVPQMNSSQPVNQFGGMNEVPQMNASQPVNQFGGMNEVPQMNTNQPVSQFGGMNEIPQINQVDVNNLIERANHIEDNSMSSIPMTPENNIQPSIENLNIPSTPIEDVSEKELRPVQFTTIADDMNNQNGFNNLEQQNQVPTGNSNSQNTFVDDLEDKAVNMNFGPAQPEVSQIDFNIPTTPVENVNQETPMAQSVNIPSAPNINPNIEIPSFMSDENSELRPKMPQIDIQPQIKLNMVQAIEDIRNCVDSLEKQGFRIEREEFDLNNNYQVVIKIRKE